MSNNFVLGSTLLQTTMRVVLSTRFHLFATYFDTRSRGVSLFFGRGLFTCLRVSGKVTIKEKAFRLIGVYVPNNFFRWIEMVSFSEWAERRSWSQLRRRVYSIPSNVKKKKSFHFVGRFYLVDKFRNEHPKWVKWTWTNRGDLDRVQISRYIDRVLVRRVNLGCPNFHSIIYSDHTLVRLRINLYKAKPKMAEYWKFNTSLLNVKDFRDQLLLTMQRELTGFVGTPLDILPQTKT